MITFSQLSIGDPIHVLEVIGTFKKCTNYYAGVITSVSKVYDEPLNPQQFPMPNQTRRKLVDIVISCDGEQKKLSVDENKSIVTDSNIGLTVATDKLLIVNMIKTTYNEYKAKREAMVRYEEEMLKCESILKKLDVKPEVKEDPRIIELQAQVDELKNIVKHTGLLNIQEQINEASN